MCGIAGIIVNKDLRGESFDLKKCILGMSDAMSARGPDNYGNWFRGDGLVAFGHRRLSIIDLDERANQPMYSNDDRYVIVFNGEIYNYLKLRKELQDKGYTFKTNSDTEVILAMYSFYGENMLSRLHGMFSIAIWDNSLETLFLARDPYGIKPLYIARSKFGWLFASQVKALLSSEIVSKERDIEGQASFWLLGSVAEPFTWFKDISSLPVGSWVKIKSDQMLDGPHRFCDIGDSWRSRRTLGPKKDIKIEVRSELFSVVD